MAVFGLRKILHTGRACEMRMIAYTKYGYKTQDLLYVSVVEEPGTFHGEQRPLTPVVYLHHESGTGDAIIYRSAPGTFTLARFDILEH